MKIETGYHQPAIVQQSIDNTADRTTSAASQQNTATKQTKHQDIVNLSSSLDTDTKQQAEQAKRVEAIKALVTSGKYQVSSRLVAEKMIYGS
jgi:flagellar biosynthesis anti-sigma factor FlgM